MWVCASLKPGTTVRPPRSTFRVAVPTSADTVAASPAAMTRSPRIASACAHGCDGFAVKILPLRRTVSATSRLLQPPTTHSVSSPTTRVFIEALIVYSLCASAALEGEIDKVQGRFAPERQDQREHHAAQRRLRGDASPCALFPEDAG